MTKSVKTRLVVLCASVLALAGCAKDGSSGFAWLQETQRVTGPDPLIEPDSFEMLDLQLILLHPDLGDGKRSVVVENTPPAEKKPPEVKKTTEQQRKELDEALHKFYDDKTEIVQRRNRVQERIIAASNQRCGQYKNFIKQFDAAANLTLGGLTTVTAGAGAIFTNLDTVRALSGIASIFSGLRAELNEAYFQNLTIQVITDGFESKRREIYEAITKKRNESKTIGAYTVEQAIGDAILYHQHCSLLAGLEQAALSIQRAENPGIKQLNKTLEELKVTRQALDVVAGAKTDLSRFVTVEPSFLTAQSKVFEAVATGSQLQGELAKKKDAIPEDRMTITEEIDKIVAEIESEKSKFENRTEALTKALRTDDKDKSTLTILLAAIDTALVDQGGAFNSEKEGEKREKARVKISQLRAKIETLATIFDSWGSIFDTLTARANRQMAVLRQIPKPAKKMQETGTEENMKRDKVESKTLPPIKKLEDIKKAAADHVGKLDIKQPGDQAKLRMFASAMAEDPKTPELEELKQKVTAKIDGAKDENAFKKFCLAVEWAADAATAVKICGDAY